MTASRIHLLIAALMGTGGVAAWAAAGHGGLASGVTAAQFLLVHVAAAIGLTACRKQGLLQARLATFAVSAMLFGAVLFAGDLAMHAFSGQRLFPFAAPAGGFLMIVGWLLAAAAAVIRADDRSDL
jgi:uncharacterized membrane protein YgdD (TMEM256/DUF423 family)